MDYVEKLVNEHVQGFAPNEPILQTREQCAAYWIRMKLATEKQLKHDRRAAMNSIIRARSKWVD